MGRRADSYSELGDFYRIDCEGGPNPSQLTASIYQGKIAVVRQSAKEAGQGPVDRVIARFKQRLQGRQGPLHKATSWQFHRDVLVTYADEGNITVVAAEADPGVDVVLVQVAHVDLTLWRDFSSTVEAEAKSDVSSRRIRNPEDRKRALVSL